MSNQVYCVIMAGGIGSRFWPMSRQSMPKQFLDILGTGSSLLQMTHHRFQHFCADSHYFVVTSDEYVSLCAEHLPTLKPNQILAEPARKNTAPCIAYAAYKLYKENPDAIMVISSSDHVIIHEDPFRKSIEAAIEHAAATDHLITLGIRPTRPDSGYGYIQFHRESPYASEQVKRVKTFTEKPTVDLALQFLQSGDFYWNSGVFIWKVSAIVAAFEAHMPDLAKSFEEHIDQLNTPAESQAIRSIYNECPSISIDYAVMEHATNVDVVLGDEFGWSDLGTWGSLFEQLHKPNESNVTLGNKIRAYDTHQSMISIPHDKLAIIQGLSNYIVIDTQDVLLICQKDEEQKIKQFVQDLKQDRENRYI